MIKQVLLTATITLSTLVSAQVTSMINDKNVDQSTKVYGMAPLTDTNKTYDKYNFIYVVDGVDYAADIRDALGLS